MNNKRIMETVVQLAGSIDPSLAKSIQSAEKSLKGLNITAIAMGAAFAGAAVTAGKALYKLGVEFDNAYDAIRIGTGATGEALEALKDDFKDVYGSVPTTMEDASKAIADYNTRLGLTGKELSELSKQAIAISGMLEEDLGTTIETSSQAFQQWSISAKDMGKQMDYIFKVSQSTGISFNELMLNMQQYGPQLQDMGYSFEEASAMMGQMEKAGVNTTEVLAAMKKAVGTLAKEGISASAGMQIYYEKIKNAKTAAEAAALANEVFGARAGSTIASAIKKGTLSVDAFTKSLKNNGETIMGVMWETADAAEKWKMLIQKVKMTFEPFASEVLDFVSDLIPLITEAFEVLSPILIGVLKLIKLAYNTLKGLYDFMKNNWYLLLLALPFAVYKVQVALDILRLKMALLRMEGGAMAVMMNSGLITGLKAFTTATWGTVKALWAQAAAWAMTPVGAITLAITALVTVVALLWKNWDKVTEACKNAFEGIKKLFGLKPKGMGDATKAVANVPIPALAAGGFTNGLSFAGEAGTEAVISFDPMYRAKNINTWLKAGELLGMSSAGGSSYNLGGFTFSPKLYISETMSADDVISKLKSAEGEFCDLIDEWLYRKTAGSYASSSFSY